MYDVIIPRTVRLSEAPGFGQPITEYDPKSRGAESYRRLAEEVASRPPPSGPMPVFDDLPTVTVPATEAAGPPDPEEDVEEDVTPPGEAHEPQPEAVGTPPAGLEAEAVDPEPEVVEPPPPPPRPRARRAPVEAELDEDLWEAPADRPAEPAPAPAPPPERRPPAREAAPTSDSRAPAEPADAADETARRVVVIDEDAADYVRPREPSAAAPPPAAPPATIGATLETEERKPRRWRLFRKGDD